MQLLGKRFSNWWLLLLAAVLVVSAPILLIFFLVVNSFAGTIFGPPAIWNRTWHSPPRADLIGRYTEPERRWTKTPPDSKVMIELRNDGSIIVSDLPFELGGKTCILTGTGTWDGPDENEKIDVLVTPISAPDACQTPSSSFLELAGHSKPYELYWVLGDPDSSTGVWFKKDQ